MTRDILPTVQQAAKVKVDPSERSIVLFGGEGSEYVGMVEDSLDLPGVQEMYEKANQIVDFDVLDVTLNGPEERLQNIQYNHVALFMANMTGKRIKILHAVIKVIFMLFSFPAIEKLKIRVPDILETTRVTAGYGVGEINALVFAEMISLEEALSYLHLRSRLLHQATSVMRTCSYVVHYTAASRLSFITRAAREWCTRQGLTEEESFCQITHYLGPQRCIIGGHEKAIEFLQLNCKEFGFTRMMRTHFPLALYGECLKMIGEMLKESVPRFDQRHSRFQVVSGIDNRSYTPERLRKNLIQQIHCPVRMEGVFSKIYIRKANVKYPRTYECSPQAHLKKLLNRCNRKAEENSKRILAC